MLKGMQFPIKNSARERTRLGLVYKETIEVSQKSGDITRIKINETSKGEVGMSYGLETEFMEFISTDKGTRVIYGVGGS